MYCTQCGQEFGSGHRFCGTCGTPVDRASNVPPAQTLAAAPGSAGIIPAFGRAKLKWWGHLPPVSASFIPEAYSWLLKDITLTVFENYLTVTPGAELRSKAADIATNCGMPFVILVAASVRGIKDKAVTALGTPTVDAFQQAFAAGELLWSRKNDAEIWEFQQKRFLGLKTPSKYLLNCSLNSPSAKTPFLFPLDRCQETFFDPVNAIGCSIVVKQSGIREDDLDIVCEEAARTFLASR